MTLSELARKTRSIRRFGQDRRVTEDDLISFVESARLAPCGANLQLLRFGLVSTEEGMTRLFPALNWAGYLRDWEGPEPGERPTGYIVIHVPETAGGHIPVDAGIAAAYMVLTAREAGFGSCMIMSFNKDGVSSSVPVPEGYRPILVIAFGEQGEDVVIEDDSTGIEYWRDSDGRHHVPKIGIDRMIIKEKMEE